MTKQDFKRTTKDWILSKKFKKPDHVYLYYLEKFDIYFYWDKSNVAEIFGLYVGFQLHNGPEEVNWAVKQVEVTNKKYWKPILMGDGSTQIFKSNFYYEDWTKEDYLEELEEVYKRYIQPYFDLGIKHVKTIAKQAWANPEAIAKVLKM